MTIDDWRARYDHLNAETDRLRAEAADLRKRMDVALFLVDALREDAARARWCERMKANIEFLPLSNCWSVSTVIGQDYRVVILSDRNAAIDAAMKGGK